MIVQMRSALETHWVKKIAMKSQQQPILDNWNKSPIVFEGGAETGT